MLIQTSSKLIIISTTNWRYVIDLKTPMSRISIICAAPTYVVTYSVPSKDFSGGSQGNFTDFGINPPENFRIWSPPRF